ncbi:MAG: hypothetical protein ACRBM6_13375 [Geminicoccales bacterium]
MKSITFLTSASILMALTLPSSAEALKTKVSFNNGIGKEAADQPPSGKTVGYQITLAEGDLEGCTIDVIESLYGREEGAWGIFDIAGDVTCANGGFAYTSSGAWDGNGFHAAGVIEDGSGTGEFEGLAGRIAQVNGSGSDAGDGTFDIAYELVVDKAGN